MRAYGGICSRSFTSLTPEARQDLQRRFAPYTLIPAGAALLIIDAERNPGVATEDGITLCGDLANPGDSLASYRRCGPAFVNTLRGEFSLVVIDEPNRRILIATDPLGVSPMYFAAIGEDLVWGTAASVVARHPDYRFSPDPIAIAEFLFTIPGNTGRSFYSNVSRLRGGTTVEVTPRTVTESFFWRPGQASTVRMRTEEAAEGLREKLGAAVRLRHEPGRTAALLSGGLDSASIVCLAASHGLDIKPYSLVFPDDPAADESTLIESVNRKWGLKGHSLIVGAELHPPTRVPGARCAPLPDLGYTPNLQMHAPQFQAMRADGKSVCLHGVGGDQLFAPDKFSFRRSVLSVLAPRYVRYLRRRFSQHSPLRFVNPSFARRHQLWRLLEPAHMPAVQSAARRSAAHAVTGASLQRAIEQLSLLAAQYEIDLRSPLLDADVVDFLLSLDPRVAFPSTAKGLLREAMKGIVPEEIRTRTTKAEFSRWFDYDLRVRNAAETRNLLGSRGPAAEVVSEAGRIAAERYLNSGDEKEGRWLCDHSVNVQRWFIASKDRLTSRTSSFEYQLGSFRLVSDIELPLAKWSGVTGKGSIQVERGVSARTDVSGRLLFYEGETQSARETLIEDLLPRFLSACGELVIHGSAAVIGTEAVVLVGPSGVGKSTLAQALDAAGHVAIADDFVPIVEPARIAAASQQRRIRPDSAAALRIPSTSITTRGKMLISGNAPTNFEVPLGQILFLERASGSEPAVHPVGRDEAFARLVESRYVFDPLDNELLKQHMDLAVAVAENVPAARLMLPHHFDAIPAVITLLESLRTPACV